MGWVPVQSYALGHVNQGVPTSPAVLQSASASTQAGSSQCVIGNWIIVFVWGATYATNIVSVSDNAGTPYTRLQINTSAIQAPEIFCAIFIGQIGSLPASGNLVITASNLFQTTMSVCASEWAGGRGSKVVEVQSAQADLTGNPNAGTLTTKTLDPLITAVCVSQDGDNPGTISVPPNFTSVGSELDGMNFKMGNGCYQVTSGSGNVSHPIWTFDPGTLGKTYAAMQLALSLMPLPQQPTSLGIGGEGN